MLGKLIKYEFKASWKYILAIDIITVVIGLFAFFISYNVSDIIDNLNSALVIILMLCLVGYMFSLIAATLLTTIYNVVHYYKSLYSSEGYLTFTLPATTGQILSAKMLVSIFWQIATSICVGLSIFFLMAGFALYGAQHGTFDFLTSIDDVYSEFIKALGVSGVFSVIRYLINIFVSIACNLLVFFFAISLGQLWSKHKVLGSILCFFGTRFALGIVSFVSSMLSGTFSTLFMSDYDPAKYFARSTTVSLLVSIFVSAILYTGCIVITDRKLNLD